MILDFLMKNFKIIQKKNYLVNWCTENNFEWEIEQDIFICKKTND